MHRHTRLRTPLPGPAISAEIARDALASATRRRPEKGALLDVIDSVSAG